MVNMIELARHFDMQVKAMRTAEENGAAAAAAAAASADLRIRSQNHEFSTVGRQDRTRRAADAHDGHVATTSPTSTPPASRKTAPSSRTCCTRTCARWAARRRRTRSAPTGLHLGTGVRVVATEKNYTQGGLNTDRQCARRRDQRPRLLPGPDARRQLRLHARRHLPVNAQGELVTSSGYACSPASRFPQGAQSITIGNDGTVSAQSPARPRRQVGQLQLTDFVNPAGLQPRGENLCSESAASGPAQTGTPGLNGLGFVAAGRARGFERQRGRRAGQHDRDPARLRDELQGDLDHRPDARVRQPTTVMTALLS